MLDKLAILIAIIDHTIHPIRIFIEVIEAGFEQDILEHEERNSHSGDEAKQVDTCECFVTLEISVGDLQVVLNKCHFI